MHRGQQGRYATISTFEEKVNAFIPNPLPPSPPIAWTPALRMRFDEALLALGKLDSAASLVPDIPRFFNMYARKEAVASSMIAGTQSSLADLLSLEMEQQPGVPPDDVQEVANYVSALTEGFRLLDGGLPLSLLLLRTVHVVLLGKGGSSDKTPGKFRRSQIWLGGTRPGNAVFVPPPPEEILACMEKLELFLHDDPEPTPALLKAALAHVQFETIHPFLDGNGRVGRLLITLILYAQKAPAQPLLYLSLYFKTHGRRYYELLNQVRETGDWEAWLEFFADAVKTTADQAFSTAVQLHALASRDRGKIAALGRAAASTLIIHQALLEHPIATPMWLSHTAGLTPATVNKSLGHLAALGIVRELTAKKRNRLFSYEEYVKLFDVGMEPPE